VTAPDRGGKGSEAPSSTRNTDATEPLLAGPPLVARHVELKPVTRSDYDFLFNLSASREPSTRWRYSGGFPNPEAFVQELWSSVLTQFVIVERAKGRPIGHLMAHRPDLRNSFAHVAVTIIPEYLGTGWALGESWVLFINYLFSLWNFRKLYAEVVGYNYDKLRSGAGTFYVEEGCLREHEYQFGRYWDVHILAFYRGPWERICSEVLPNLLEER